MSSTLAKCNDKHTRTLHTNLLIKTMENVHKLEMELEEKKRRKIEALVVSPAPKRRRESPPGPSSSPYDHW